MYSALKLGLSLSSAGGSAIPTVRRMVGTLNDSPNNGHVSDGVSDSFNTIRGCYAKYDIVNPSAVYVGWSTLNGEINFPNAVTVRTALYAVDKTTLLGEFKKSGVVAQVISPGDAFNETDQLILTIPAGTFFYIVTYGTVAGGGLFYGTDYGRNNTLGTRSEHGVGLADRHLNPSAITNTFAGYGFNPPVGLMASVPSSRRLIAIHGDSISAGIGNYVGPLQGALGSSAGGGAGYMAGYCDGRFDYCHFGRSGNSAAFMETNGAKRYALMGAIGATDLWSDLGINDLSYNNVSSAGLKTSLETNYAAIVAAAPTVIRIFQSTITPFTTNTGVAPTSDTNQSVLVGGAQVTNLSDGRRQTFNAVVRAVGLTGQFGYVEAALSVENALSDYWWIAGASQDFLHPNPSGGATLVARCVNDNALAPDPPPPPAVNLAAGIVMTMSLAGTLTGGQTTVRQSSLVSPSFPFPVYVNETAVRQSSLAGTYINEV